MKKTIITTVFSMFTLISLNAQITLYKIENGIKTPLTAAEKKSIEIPLDDNMVPTINLLAEYDVKAFKEKYTYDNLLFFYSQPGEKDVEYINYGVNFSFNSPMNSKKYGKAQFIRMYLFGTEEVESDNNNLWAYEPKIGNTESTVQYALTLWGRYITGQEEYYQDGAWQKGNKYSTGEPVFQTLINYKTSAGGALTVRYDLLVRNGRSEEKLVGRNEINKQLDAESKRMSDLSIMNPLTGKGVSLYPNAYQSFIDIWNFKNKEIDNEKDKQKAIDLLTSWSADYPMVMVSQKDKPTLKALNKELKGELTIDEKIAVFKKYKETK